MTLYDLTDKEIFLGNKPVSKMISKEETIYRFPVSGNRYAPSNISPLATLAEFDYTRPDGARLTDEASDAVDHRFIFNRNSAYLGPVDTEETAVFEYVLKKPTYISGLRSIIHLDLIDLSNPLYFNLYIKSGGFSMESYWDRDGIIQMDDSYVPIPNDDEFIIMQFVYTKLSSGTTFKIYINGTMFQSGSNAIPINGTQVNKGWFNYAFADAGIMTSMSELDAGADVYELAVYDLKTNEAPAYLFETNYLRAQSLYNTN